MFTDEGESYTLLDQIAHPIPARGLRYWAALRPAPHRLPGRQHLDPADIPHLLPWVILYDVLDGPEGPGFRFRLIGTELVGRYGRDATGRTFEEVYAGEILARQLRFFRDAVARAEPLASRGRLPVPEREHITYERLVLPLARDGIEVDMLMAVMGFDDAA